MGLLNRLASLFYEGSGKDIQERQGTGGSKTIGGILLSAEKSPKLSSIGARMKTYSEMALNVAIVATGLRYFSSMISGIRWTCKPAKDGGAEAEKYAKLIELIMNNMDVPFYKVVRTAAQFKWMGFSIQECIARRMDELQPGLIGIGTVESRPQTTIEEWYLEDQSNVVEGWKQRDPNTNEVFDLDRDRCIYIYDDTLTSSPDGVGLLRHVVELCDQLRKLEQLEGWAFETDLRGIPLGRAPTALIADAVKKNKITQAEADKMLDGITKFVENHMRNPDLGLLLDSQAYTSSDTARTPSSMKMWDLELVKGEGTGLAEINIAIERKCHEIARLLGCEQFMLGQTSTGSLALSEDKSRNLLELIKATIREVSWALRCDYVKKIFQLNHWPLKYLPELMPDAASLRSVTVLVDALAKLALAGAVIDRNDPIINQIRSMMDLVDQPEVTAEMIALTNPPNDGGNPKSPGSKTPKKPSGKNPDNKKLSEMIEEVLEEWRQAA